MNILIYFSTPINPHSGGTERVAHMVATYLSEQGHSVSYLACERRNIEYERETLYLPEPVESSTGKNVAFVKQFVANRKIDVIINEAGNGDSVFLFSHEHIPLNVNIITHIHFDIVGDLRSFYRSLNLPVTGVSVRTAIKNALKWIKAPYNRRNATQWKKARFNYIVKNTDKIVLLTPQHVRDFNNMIGCRDTGKVVFATNPVSAKPIELEFAEKENLIIFVGRLSYSKRVDRILKVWQRVYKQHPDWQLAIIGSGADESRLQKLSRDMQLPRVRFVGHADPDPYYRKAKILLMTSNYEGTPMVIHEAMSFGTVPVVMDTFCAARTMIDEGSDGVITKYLDVSDMCRAVSNLMDSPKTLEQMSKNAIAKINGVNNDALLSTWDKLIIKNNN